MDDLQAYEQFHQTIVAEMERFRTIKNQGGRLLKDMHTFSSRYNRPLFFHLLEWFVYTEHKSLWIPEMENALTTYFQQNMDPTYRVTFEIERYLVFALRVNDEEIARFSLMERNFCFWGIRPTNEEDLSERLARFHTRKAKLQKDIEIEQENLTTCEAIATKPNAIFKQAQTPLDYLRILWIFPKIKTTMPQMLEQHQLEVQTLESELSVIKQDEQFVQETYRLNEPIYQAIRDAFSLLAYTEVEKSNMFFK